MTQQSPHNQVGYQPLINVFSFLFVDVLVCFSICLINKTIPYFILSPPSIDAGRPDPVRSCAITNHSMSTLLVECAAGDDGGLHQHFNLEVYVASSQRLHSNHTSSQPNFLVSSLTPGTQYALILYASNAKGRSHAVTLSAVTLAPPEKHMSSRGTCHTFPFVCNVLLFSFPFDVLIQTYINPFFTLVGLTGSFEQIVVHPMLAILIGIVAFVVLFIILIIVLIRARHSRYRAAQQRNSHNGSDGSAPLTSNGDLKMNKVKMNGNAASKSNGKLKKQNGEDHGKGSGLFIF